MGCALYMIVTRPFQMFNGKYEQTGGIIKYSQGVHLSVLTKKWVDLKSWSTNIQFVFLNSRTQFVLFADLYLDEYKFVKLQAILTYYGKNFPRKGLTTWYSSDQVILVEQQFG